MNPDNEPVESIDPPDNTGGGTTAPTDMDLESGEAQAAIDPPDNTGGGR
jgi:hypothetical protein